MVKVTDGSGNPLINAPVLFTVTDGGGHLTPSIWGSTYTYLQATTDAGGYAQVYFIQPGTANITSHITATTGGQSVTFTETDNPDAPLAPTGLTVAVSDTPGAIDLSWTNHATDADATVIQVSDDNGQTWTTLATLAPTATTYTAGGLSGGVSYNFRVTATKTGSSSSGGGSGGGSSSSSGAASNATTQTPKPTRALR